MLKMDFPKSSELKTTQEDIDARKLVDELMEIKAMILKADSESKNWCRYEGLISNKAKKFLQNEENKYTVETDCCHECNYVDITWNQGDE